MTWALWQDKQHRAAKMHVHFEVLRGIPIHVDITTGNGSERAALKHRLKPSLMYVIDRGYADYQLFQEIIDRKSSVIGRIRENAIWRRVKERLVSAKASQAGVQRDLEVWLGSDQSGKALKQPLRIVEVNTGKVRDFLIWGTDGGGGADNSRHLARRRRRSLAWIRGLLLAVPCPGSPDGSPFSINC